MNETNCPICYTELITRKVTPCEECGGDESELDHYKEHSYNEYELYFGQRLVLCNFCDVDFSSYDPTYFGFSKDRRLGLEDFNFVREESDKRLRKDKYCPECHYRLSFLRFVAKCRLENEETAHNTTRLRSGPR